MTLFFIVKLFGWLYGYGVLPEIGFCYFLSCVEAIFEMIIFYWWLIKKMKVRL